MGVFARFVDKAQKIDIGHEVNHDSDRLFTPANIMTFSRVPLALLAANRLRSGKQGAFVFAVAMAASDAEGNVARFIDRKFPNSGYGTTNQGKIMDPIADTLGLLTLCGSALLSPKLSTVSKIAISTVLCQEGVKAVWATRVSSIHEELTGEMLDLPVSYSGKEAMAEKFSAVLLAVGSNEAASNRQNFILSLGALGLAITGCVRGESARRTYDAEFTQSIPYN